MKPEEFIIKFLCMKCGKYFMQRSRFKMVDDQMQAEPYWNKGQRPILVAGDNPNEVKIFCEGCFINR